MYRKWPEFCNRQYQSDQGRPDTVYLCGKGSRLSGHRDIHAVCPAGFEYILSPYIEHGNAKPEKYSNFQIRQLCFTYSFPDFEYFLNTRYTSVANWLCNRRFLFLGF